MAGPALSSTASTAADGAPRRTPDAGRPRPPALENGDRLTRCEFERRYAARPDLRKAELIEGVVHVPSPVRAASYAEPHYSLIGWLAAYSAATPGVRGADNATVLAEQHRGLRTPEHREFVTRLASAEPEPHG